MDNDEAEIAAVFGLSYVRYEIVADELMGLRRHALSDRMALGKQGVELEVQFADPRYLLERGQPGTINLDGHFGHITVLEAGVRAMGFIPCLRYRKPAEAVAWLEKAFGLTRHFVVEGPDGGIEHAELRLGDAVVMVGGPKKDGAFDRFVAFPRDIGGLQTQTIYAVVPDVASHLSLARSAGARIVQPLTGEPYGTIYSAADCEGHIWSFGDYDPLTTTHQAPVPASPPDDTPMAV